MSDMLSREEFATQLHRVIDSAQLDVEEGQLLAHDAVLRAESHAWWEKFAECDRKLAAMTAERDAYQLASAEHWTESFNPDDENNVVPKVTWYRAKCAILQAELNEARKLISDWETPDECRALLQQQLATVTAELTQARDERNEFYNATVTLKGQLAQVMAERDEAMGALGYPVQSETPCGKIVCGMCGPKDRLLAERDATIARLQEHQWLHDRIFARQKLLMDEQQAHITILKAALNENKDV